MVAHSLTTIIKFYPIDRRSGEDMRNGTRLNFSNSGGAERRKSEELVNSGERRGGLPRVS